MKKNYIVLCLIGIIAFFSYTPCVLGVDTTEKESIVTINGIEMSYDAATALVKHITKEEKEIANIVDKSTEKYFDIEIEALKPGMDILINNSKNMETILELFEISKEHVMTLKDNTISQIQLKNKPITLMKINDKFCIIDDNNKIILFINNKIQISKINIFPATLSGIEKAIPIHEIHR
jgi:hypothetical protein